MQDRKLRQIQSTRLHSQRACTSAAIDCLARCVALLTELDLAVVDGGWTWRPVLTAFRGVTVAQ